MAVDLCRGEVSIGIVSQLAVRFRQAPVVAVAQHRPVRQSSASGESSQREQPDHTKNFTIIDLAMATL
ncbi:hypothetical protein AN480_27910 (plasmid) [Mycobacterium intracellulare subsp. chimaera]|nr:hypothetical protein AN480_27910 [Mycobacterium intracellulare subsp. chimaera]